MLRAFIKNTVHREAWNGAPWLVKDSYAKAYSITQNIPKHLQRGSTVAERKAMLAVRKAQAEKGFSLTIAGTGPGLSPDPTPPKPTKGKGKQKDLEGKQSILSLSSTGILKIQTIPEPPKPPPKPLIKYPIEDLTIMPSATLKKRPTLKRLHEVVPGKKLSEESVPLLLETWVFLNVYCEPFLLDSFTFDDYIEALFYNDDHQECALLLEIHCAMLKALVDEGEEGKVKIASILDLDSEDEDEEEEEEEEDLPMQTRRSSARFKELSKVTINGHGDNQNPVWLELIRKREFKNGGWETIVVGLFSQISGNTQFKSLATEVLRYFSPLGDAPVLHTAKAQYKDTDINTKIKIIQLLQKLTFETSIVRNYMEECGEAMTKLRKDKIEHQKTRKIFIEELKSLEDERRQLMPENEPSSPTKEMEEGDTKMSNGYDTPEIDNDGEDSDSSRRAIRRPSNRAAERKRKREQEKEKEEANAKLQESVQKYKRACLNVDKAKAKIRQEEAAITELDSDLRESDCARLRLLGRDRFWNRYWFFERNGMPYAGIPTSSTADSGFAMGRLWLQGASLEEQKEFLDLDRVVNNDTNDGTRVPMSIKERRKREEGTAALRGPEKWAYIDDPEDLQNLLDWLDIKGERELKLKKELEIYKEHMFGAMEARQRYLSPPDSNQGGEVVVRMSTRTKSVAQIPVQRCLKWKNNLAVERLGHYHSEQAVRPKGRKGQQEAKSSRTSRAR
ncbi:hypothetical protein ABW20_dc0105453 [Dactylellina cionopaga]|nr:hypothetical protein ABW20_dc0105453 [Dactylellina cionopaga]